MIEPMLATMLGFVTTDAAVPPALLQRALIDACETTFNAITVDGECSTNDTVFALASGASGVRIDEAGYDAFVEALRVLCRELAMGIVRGGEGATKLITVQVTGARTTTTRGGRPRHRQLAAGEDSDPRRRSEPGPWSRSPAAAAPLLARRRAGDDRRRRPVRERAAIRRARQQAARISGQGHRVAVDLGTDGREDATMWASISRPTT
jgi:glutamate N-acetyltransferase/amino-acid N-acetyltransferase